MKAALRIALEQTPCQHRKLRSLDPHPCPYQLMVHGDEGDFCRCCDGCVEDCEREADKDWVVET
jgi:hypothetical protein